MNGLKAKALGSIFASFSFRPARGWVAVLLSGLVTLLLSSLTLRQWPVSGLWAVGVLVRVDLLMTGVSLVTLASTLRRFIKPAKNDVGT